jgi:hypothetical protein
MQLDFQTMMLSPVPKFLRFETSSLDETGSWNFLKGA